MALTESERWRLAQIVAIGLERGEAETDIRSRLTSYVRGASADDINSAVKYGKEARFLGEALSQYDDPTLRFAAQEMLAGMSGPFRGLMRVKIGAGEGDWRSAVLRLPAGATPADIAAEANRQIQALRERSAYEDFKADWGEPEIVFLVPQ